MEVLAISIAVCAFWHYCYYLLSPWIWNQNLHPDPADLTSQIRVWTSERDGIEVYALYILVFLCGGTALSVSALLARKRASLAHSAMLVLCGATACFYCAKIGFVLPSNSLGSVPAAATIRQSVEILAFCAPLIAILAWIRRRYPRAGLIMAGIFLAPACFIATEPVSWTDYTYVFSPALRILTGAGLSDIYFQYDFLPSLLAAAWMKLGLGLDSFQVLGQAAYYLVILGVFALSAALFRQSYLPVFLLSALVLGRIYASPFDAVSVFQVTPLRIDLWLPLLAVVYRKGPFHWSAGLVCGLLLLVLRTFGIIYSIAYLQLLATLWIIERCDAERPALLQDSCIAYIRRCSVPVATIAICAGAGHFLFHNPEFGNYAGYYRKIGIGFIRIAQNSFYWYVPAMISMVSILLVALRKRLSSGHVATGILLIYCAIGNSIYFFGRSHEHNIINISIILIFLFFFLLDLVARTLDPDGAGNVPASFGRQIAAPLAASTIIMVMAVAYSNSISGKFLSQAANVRQARMHYPFEISEHIDPLRSFLGSLAVATNNSAKVFFAATNDFELYYWGGYAPVGYCNPFQTWIFTKDLKRFLQNLLDSGYYLVFGSDQQYLLAGLRYDELKVVQGAIVATRQSAKDVRP